MLEKKSKSSIGISNGRIEEHHSECEQDVAEHESGQLVGVDLAEHGDHLETHSDNIEFDEEEENDFINPDNVVRTSSSLMVQKRSI